MSPRFKAHQLYIMPHHVTTNLVEYVCRPESRIAVVSHSKIMHRILSAITKNQPAHVRYALREIFGHCEMRSTVLSGSDSQDVQCTSSLTP